MSNRGTLITDDLEIPRLPRVKMVKARGMVYAYFCSGRKVNGEPYRHPLPSITSPDFHAEYERHLALFEEAVRDTFDGSQADKKIRYSLRRVRRHAEPRIYFIGSHRAGFVKIGYSINPKARLATLQVGHPGKLAILATVVGDQLLEAEYHRRFADYHVYGEWFRLNRPIKTEIKRINGERTKRGEENG